MRTALELLGNLGPHWAKNREIGRLCDDAWLVWGAEYFFEKMEFAKKLNWILSVNCIDWVIYKQEVGCE